MISKDTAFHLFGSVHVVGKEVTCKGKSWIIRGVTADSYPLILLSGDRLGADGYQNLSFVYGKRTRGGIKYETEQLAFRYGLPQEVMIDGSLCAAAARLAAVLPAWVLLFCAAWKGKKFVGKWWGSLCFLVCIIGSGVLILAGVHLPEYFIPTRWADFQFFQELWSEIARNAEEIRRLPKTVWDLEIITSFGRCVREAGLACGGMVLLQLAAPLKTAVLRTVTRFAMHRNGKNRRFAPQSSGFL